MGKRSNFVRVDKDFYPTPLEAVFPLLPHLRPLTKFHEPCAGEDDLIYHLEKFNHRCVQSGDISTGQDVFEITFTEADCFITNPPWSRKILHPLISHLCTMKKPVWLLFDADWMHTKQSIEYMKYCRKIVSVGRVKWIKDSPHTGKDNVCWYLFGDKPCPPPFFIGRNIGEAING